MNLIRTTLALAAAFVLLPASAAQFDFHKLKSPTQPGDFNATNGVACTGGDRCSSNVDGGVFGGSLHYVNGGIALDASGPSGSV